MGISRVNEAHPDIARFREVFGAFLHMRCSVLQTATDCFTVTLEVSRSGGFLDVERFMVGGRPGCPHRLDNRGTLRIIECNLNIGLFTFDLDSDE